MIFARNGVSLKNCCSKPYCILRERLIDEWKNKDDLKTPRPNIIQKKDDQGNVIDICVIWDDYDWNNMDQLTRSEIIADAYWEVFGEKGLRLLSATGLSEKEAKII